MFVGIMKIELRFQTALSLKDKRSIVNRVKMKIASRFKINVAEVEDQAYYNSSVLGVAIVSLKRAHADSKCQKIITFLEEEESHVFYDAVKVVEEY